jgi:hypothetical protein
MLKISGAPFIFICLSFQILPSRLLILALQSSSSFLSAAAILWQDRPPPSCASRSQPCLLPIHPTPPYSSGSSKFVHPNLLRSFLPGLVSYDVCFCFDDFVSILNGGMSSSYRLQSTAAPPLWPHGGGGSSRPRDPRQLLLPRLTPVEDPWALRWWRLA